MFLVFAYDTYYPEGGVNDLVATTETYDEAFAALLAHLAESTTLDHAQIYDTTTGLTGAWIEEQVGTGAMDITEDEADQRFPRRVTTQDGWVGDRPDKEYRYGWVRDLERQTTGS